MLRLGLKAVEAAKDGVFVVLFLFVESLFEICFGYDFLKRPFGIKIKYIIN